MNQAIEDDPDAVTELMWAQRAQTYPNSSADKTPKETGLSTPLSKDKSARRINERSRGSNPVSGTKFRFKWAEELKCSVGVYVRRWYVETPIGSLRIHHWLHSDDARAFHDHTWWFWTFVVKGGYRDVSASGEESMKAPKIAFRPATHAHTVQVDKGGCWTILLTGPQVRKWGFWVGKKWKKANKYFFENGTHICD